MELEGGSDDEMGGEKGALGSGKGRESGREGKSGDGSCSSKEAGGMG